MNQKTAQHQKIMPPPTKAWYKQFWPWFLIALPGSVVIASMFTITLAVQNAPVIIQKDIGRFMQTIKTETPSP